jgi:hypothetical protein
MPLRHAPDRVEAVWVSAEITIYMRQRVRAGKRAMLACRPFQYVAFRDGRQWTIDPMLCALAHITR